MLTSAADRINSAGKRMLTGAPVTAESQKRLQHSAAANVVCGFALTGICILAFSLRLFSVIKYESVIHEFDPYFNYRVTQFLTKEGFYNLWNWFDDRTWYPLGRVVGGTVYPVCLTKVDTGTLSPSLLYLTTGHACVGLNLHSRCHLECPALLQHSHTCPGGMPNCFIQCIYYVLCNLVTAQMDTENPNLSTCVTV